MTTEEAARNLEHAKKWHDLPTDEAIDIAIKALEQPETCEDAISRQAAIDAFEDTTYTKNEIQRRITELPSAQPEKRWIPVSERLPEEDGTYIVSGVWDSGKKQVGECEFYVHDGYFQTSWNFDAKAWMPRPKAYDEGRK